MKFIDFFSGIGGIRHGLEMAGHRCIGFCEYDKYAVASYTSMYLITDEQREFLKTLSLRSRQKEILKEEYRNGEWYANDIRQVHGEDLPRADCWCFGAPCQSFSICGRRAGFEGESGLVREIFRILDELSEEDRPEWLIYENVRGMLSSNKGWDYAAILSEMEQGGMILNGKISILPDSSRKTGSAYTLLDIIEDSAPEKYYLSKEQMEKIIFSK